MLAQIHFDDFASNDELSLVGDAGVSGTVLRITPAPEKRQERFRDKQSVGSGFETTFRFQLTHHDWLFFRGADGFAFVAQNSGLDALGGMGSATGFSVSDQLGVPLTRAFPGRSQFSSIRIGTRRRVIPPRTTYALMADPPVTRWPPARLAASSNLRVHLKDGKVLTARIIFSRRF